ncbi:MAG: hypothetical protein HRU38_26075, partial [Saccharospirillaceae bacterium]|nr:hypothetical protein [Saccharospirillaceae bacterium]
MKNLHFYVFKFLILFSLFSLTACDKAAQENTSSTETTTTSNTNEPNKAPIASTNDNVDIFSGELVFLLGQDSQDSDGNITAFLWQQTSGPTVDLSSYNSKNTSFIAPDIEVATQLYFLLTVTDNDAASGSDLIIVTVFPVNNPVDTENTEPVANAGMDQSVISAQTVILNGSNSADSDGQITAVYWQTIDGTVVEFSNANVLQTSFQAPQTDTIQTIILQLTVTDNNGATHSDFITITINPIDLQNIDPIANAGMDQSVFSAQTVIINGSLSTDSDGEISSVHWQVLNDVLIEFDNANVLQTSFQAPQTDIIQTIFLQLTVTDNDGATDSALIKVTINPLEIQNIAPVANAGLDIEGLEGETIQLDASGSNDVDGDIQSYLWTQTSGPQINIINANQQLASFIAPYFGSSTNFQFSVNVVDDQDAQHRDTVDVTINAQPESVSDTFGITKLFASNTSSTAWDSSH